MSDQSGSQSYRLLASHRWVTLIGPLTLIATGVFVYLAFSKTDFWWWSILIMASPTLLSVLIAFEVAQLRLEISDKGLCYHSVGYVAEVPWSRVSRHPAIADGLVLDQPDIRFSRWLGWMVPVLALLLPSRARYAGSSMRVVPLRYFDDGTLGAAISRLI